MLIGGVSTLIGGLITWLVARRYYKKAGNELRAEAKELQRLNGILLRVMEAVGLTEISRDESGKPLGLKFTLQVNPGQYEIRGSEMTLEVSRNLQNQDKPVNETE